MPTIRHEQPQDLNAIETLLDRVFGADRHAKKSYAYRNGIKAIETLSHVGYDDAGELVATIRYWPVVVGGNNKPALLLGPIAVKPERKGEGIGVRLMEMTLQMAANTGHRLVVLVGDAPYYARFGFKPASAFSITMPGEAPERVQALFLDETAMMDTRGEVKKAG